ncbi:MAG: hypothetical protein CMJ95_02485 [Planctomycetes bacterium]|nr:hypothetical protein [Planctomycetota bacterium]
MKKWLSLLTLLLLLLAALSSIPALPLNVDLRGRWLQVHLLVAAPLAFLIVVQIWWLQIPMNPLKAAAWLSVSTGLGLIVVPLLGLTGTESTHLWIQSHGWLSLLGVGLLGFSAARAFRKG